MKYPVDYVLAHWIQSWFGHILMNRMLILAAMSLCGTVLSERCLCLIVVSVTRLKVEGSNPRLTCFSLSVQLGAVGPCAVRLQPSASGR